MEATMVSPLKIGLKVEHRGSFFQDYRPSWFLTHNRFLKKILKTTICGHFVSCRLPVT